MILFVNISIGFVMVKRTITITGKIIKESFITDSECIYEIIRIGTDNGIILDRSKIEKLLYNNEILCAGLILDPYCKLIKYKKVVN